LGDGVDFLEVRLEAPREAAAELRSFYTDRLELEGLEHAGDLLGVRVGISALGFSAAPAGPTPFYHFAFLVPGNRFEEAHAWLGARARLLPDPDTGDTDFDFRNWDARACYCLDPAGNIVELVAHRGVSEGPLDGAFSGCDIVGFSEVGLVVANKEQSVAVLDRERDLHVWDGDVSDPRRLVFVGERARTLILCPPGRGWLPTDRRAEIHPVEVVLTGAPEGETRLPGTPHRVIAARRPG
jgi:catechol 2,3-dioxygenase-like lactoylglutathione lyase family enzyme